MKVKKIIISAIVIVALIKIFHTEDNGGAITSQAEKASKQQLSPIAEVERRANITAWYDDKWKDSKRVRKLLGKDSDKIKEIFFAAAYRASASIKNADKVMDVNLNDDKSLTAVVKIAGVDDYQMYDIRLKDTKDSAGSYYNAASSISASKIESRAQKKQRHYEELEKKAFPKDQSIALVREVILKNATHPSTVDMDNFNFSDKGLYEDGTREFETGFSAKNNFGLELHYSVIVNVSPKGVAKIAYLDEDGSN